MNGSFCNLCWADVTYLRYTVLTSPSEDETAVHCCDLALSVLVMLVSRNVVHVVSALQSIVFMSVELTEKQGLDFGLDSGLDPRLDFALDFIKPS